jgi:hypothetical protein
MSRFAAPAVAVCLVLAASAALAQSEGTDEEQDACQPDAVRFCKAAIPDTFKVLTCLQTNRTRISKACREVLKSHGVLEPAAPAQSGPKDR